MQVFVDSDNILLTIPNLYLYSTYKNLSHYVKIITKAKNGLVKETLEYRSVSLITANQYAGRLYNFLLYLKSFDDQHNTNFFYSHVNIPQEIMNDYINDELIIKQEKGDYAVKQAKDAIQSYYNFLAKIGFTTVKEIFIRPKLRHLAVKNTRTRLSIKYLNQSQQNVLIRCCKKMSHKLAIRLGAECGLRSKELRGLRLNDFVYFGKRHKGILSLILDMKNNDNQTEFEFFLQGIYTKGSSNKGGRSRTIYITDELLISIDKYINEERKSVQNENSTDSLLLQKDGFEIPNCFGTDTFNTIKKRVIKQTELFEDGQPLVDKEHSFHILRHSFGTDKFHEFASKNRVDPDSVTPNSAVMIEVARLLGHSLKGKSGLATTTRYIRSLHDKLKTEIYFGE